jgi:ABC-2 type transport system ATP-binding protein
VISATDEPDTAPGPVLRLAELAIGRGPGATLPAMSATARPTVPGVVLVETEETPVVASLVAAGRMVAERGRLLLDGVKDRSALRGRSALVDTPDVAEPFPVLTLRQITYEELTFAEQPNSPDAVTTVLEVLDMRDLEHTAVQHVPTHLRVRLLCELALLRDGVDILVVTTPERHGGDPAAWLEEIQRIADRGVTVLLVTSNADAATRRWRTADGTVLERNETS